jgi:putative redox protein
VKATATRLAEAGLRHRITIRQHELTVDEPEDQGGEDSAPTPLELLAASLATCVAITLEMYAARKGWDIGRVQCSCEFDLPARGELTKFSVTVRLPEELSAQQVERLRVIAGKCPVHRVLLGDVEVDDEFELGSTRTA